MKDPTGHEVNFDDYLMPPESDEDLTDHERFVEQSLLKIQYELDQIGWQTSWIFCAVGAWIVGACIGGAIGISLWITGG